MKILQRLYLKELLKLLCLLAVGMSIIVSLLELIDKLDSFMPGRPTAGNLVLYILFNMPRFFLYLLPMSVLISSLFTFSQASGRREITAIKAAGGRLRILFYPFILAGVLLSFFAFAVSETIAPDFSKRAVELKHVLEGKSKRPVFNEGGLWLKGKDGSPVKIDLYIIEKKIAKGVSIFVVGEDFLTEKVLADKAYWDGNSWVLEDITKYDFKTGKTERLKTMNYQNLESPDLFTEQIKTIDEMGAGELYGYMRRLKKAGFRNIKLAVDFNSKISFPLINFFMMLLGISLSMKGNLGRGLFSAGLGLLISLLYWFSYTFSLSMGYAGIIPPLVSAWLIPSLFSMFAVFLFLKIPE